MGLNTKVKPMEILDQELLKQYIRYAKEKFKKTSISDKCSGMIKEFYKTLRDISATAGGLNITPRYL